MRHICLRPQNGTKGMIYYFGFGDFTTFKNKLKNYSGLETFFFLRNFL